MNNWYRQWQMQWTRLSTVEQMCLTGAMIQVAEKEGVAKKEFREMIEATVLIAECGRVLAGWAACVPATNQEGWMWWYGLWLKKAGMIPAMVSIQDGEIRCGDTVRQDGAQMPAGKENEGKRTLRSWKGTSDTLPGAIIAGLKKAATGMKARIAEGDDLPSHVWEQMECLWNDLWKWTGEAEDRDENRRAVWDVLAHLNDVAGGKLPIPLSVLERLVSVCRLENWEDLPAGLWHWTGGNAGEQMEIQKMWVGKAHKCRAPVREHLWKALLERYRESPAMVELAADLIQQTTSWRLLDMIAGWKPETDTEKKRLREEWRKKLRSPDMHVVYCAWKGWQTPGNADATTWQETCLLAEKEIEWAAIRGIVNKLLFWSQASGQIGKQCPEGETAGRQWLTKVWETWREHHDPDIQCIVWLTLLENGREAGLEKLMGIIRSEPLQSQVISRLERLWGDNLETARNILAAWESRAQWDVPCRQKGADRLATVIDRFVLCPVKTPGGEELWAEHIAGIEEPLRRALDEDTEQAVARTRQILKRHWQKYLAAPWSGEEGQPDLNCLMEWYGMLLRLGDDREVLNWWVRWAETSGKPIWNMELADCLEKWEPEGGWNLLWEQEPEKMELLWRSIGDIPIAAVPAHDEEGHGAERKQGGVREEHQPSDICFRLVSGLCRLDNGGERFWGWLENVIRRTTANKNQGTSGEIFISSGSSERGISRLLDICVRMSRENTAGSDTGHRLCSLWWKASGMAGDGNLLSDLWGEISFWKLFLGVAGWCNDIWPHLVSGIRQNRIPGQTLVRWLKDPSGMNDIPPGKRTWKGLWQYLTSHPQEEVAAAAWAWIVFQNVPGQETECLWDVAGDAIPWENAVTNEERMVVLDVLARCPLWKMGGEKTLSIWNSVWEKRLTDQRGDIRQLAWNARIMTSRSWYSGVQELGVVLAGEQGRGLGKTLQKHLGMENETEKCIGVWDAFLQDVFPQDVPAANRDREKTCGEVPCASDIAVGMLLAFELMTLLRGGHQVGEEGSRRGPQWSHVRAEKPRQQLVETGKLMKTILG